MATFWSVGRMTLRDFIQTEIEAGNVFDVAEFGEKLHSLNCEGEEEE